MATEIERIELNDRVEYRLNDQLHREDGPAIERVSGTKAWYLNGKRHRTDGPAREQSGNKSWWFNGRRHRPHGPAIEWANGDKEWYLNGKNVPKHQVNEFRCQLFLKSLIVNRLSYKYF